MPAHAARAVNSPIVGGRSGAPFPVRRLRVLLSFPGRNSAQASAETLHSVGNVNEHAPVLGPADQAKANFKDGPHELAPNMGDLGRIAI